MWLGVAAVAIVAWVKAKVISSAIGTFAKAIQGRFWKYVGKHVAQVTPTPSPPSSAANEKTYRGKFYSFSQYENWPQEWCVTLINDGVMTKVHVARTNLLSGVSPGEFIELDTDLIPGNLFEHVRRVRIVSK